MLDHVSLPVSELEGSAVFYDAVLATLGLVRRKQRRGAVGYGPADRPAPVFWLLDEGSPDRARPGRGLHLSFEAPDRAAVDAFFRAAIERGARSAGPPGERPEYTRPFYGAFVIDPNGFKIEAVCRGQPAHAASVLSHEDARRTYDRIGSLQDSQGFYEDRATGMVLREGDFGSAEAVFEFGCGTGRFALRLFTDFLAPGARYRGVDLSPRMVSLARARLAPYGTRAEVVLTEGGPPVDEPSGSRDRFVSNYVFDLLSEEEIRAVLGEAHRMLRADGLLCLAGLSTGVGPVSRAVERLWGWVQRRRPSLVGGCRPIDVLPLLPVSSWQVRHHAKVVAFGVTSEVLVARRRADGPGRGAAGVA